MLPKEIRWPGTILMTLVMLGCAEGGPKVVPVGGKVSLKGKPVSGASITFSQEGSPRNAFGETDSEGKYQLTTYAANDGATPGEHKISVSKPTIGMTPPSAGDFGADYGKAMMESRAKKKVINTDIPGKYTDMKTTPLKRNVDSKGPNVIDLELVD